MTLRIIVNNKEYTNPVVKYGLVFSFLLGAVAVSALIIFVLLPAIGITIVMSMGLVIIIAVGVFAAAVALTLGSVIFAGLLAITEKLLGRPNDDAGFK